MKHAVTHIARFQGKNCSRIHALNAQKGALCATDTARWPVTEVDARVTR